MMTIRYYRDIPKQWESDLNRIRERIIEDLRDLALKGGVRDNSYPTVRYGRVPSYEGTAIIRYNNKRFKATGYAPKGSPEFLDKDGGIVFTEM